MKTVIATEIMVMTKKTNNNKLVASLLQLFLAKKIVLVLKLSMKYLGTRNNHLI